MPIRNRSLFLFLIIFFCIWLAACSTKPTLKSPDEEKSEHVSVGFRGGKITYRLVSAPKTFNYLLADDEASVMTAFFMLTSRLVEFDHRTQTFVPGLAESWVVGTDGATVDVKLRDGLKFSDGTPLRADDVIFTLNAIYDDRTKSPVFRDSMMIDDKPIGTKRVSDTELMMIFPKPVASVENYLSNLGVLSAAALEPELKGGTLAAAWTINSPPASIVSSGPFVVQTAVPGERVEYARNPNYWKKDKNGIQLPYLDALNIEVIPDPNNTFGRLSQGSIDIADRIRASDFSELSKAGGDVRASDIGPGLGIDHLWFNLNATDPNGVALNNAVKRAWFGDKRFRQAIAMAIDRESIASITLQGLATPLYGFVSPGNRVWLNPDQPKIRYDLSGAAKLLSEAGFNKTGTAENPVLVDVQKNPVDFTLIVPAESEARKLIAGVIQEDLAKLGVKMQIAPIDFPSLTQRWTKTYDYDAVLLGLSQNDTEPSSFANFLQSAAATHQWHPKQKTPATDWEARIDKLFADQSAERDQTKRRAIFSEIQKIMFDEMPVLPVVARHAIGAANKRVGNYSPSGILPYSLWNIDELYIKR